MQCIPHCGTCHHMCINSPGFKKLSLGERMKIIWDDEKIVPDENSGVYIVTPENMMKMMELGEKAYS